MSEDVSSRSDIEKDKIHLSFTPGDKLAVWTADARNAENNLKIGRTLKQRLNIPKTVTIGFQVG